MTTPASALSAPVLDRVLFGDNQFFGVNHMSEEKARSQQMRFQRLDAVLDVLQSAQQAGVRTFMCTTHERVSDICDVVRSDPGPWAGLTFMPCMPYAHKYANAITDDGFLGAVRRFVPQQGLLEAVATGSRSLAARDLDGLATLLVDAEMTMFKGLPTPVVWLQNVVVDLLLGLGAHDSLRTFSEHVKTRYGAEPGFITMNLPRLVNALDEVGVANPLVCANINKMGFRMHGGIDAYVDVLRNREVRAVAMSVFASGAIPAEEAIEWVCGLPNLESIVFGASSRANIDATVKLIDRFWP